MRPRMRFATGTRVARAKWSLVRPARRGASTPPRSFVSDRSPRRRGPPWRARLRWSGGVWLRTLSRPTR
eukprot:11019395-Lingulodinium_polyedra.AAC.1